MAECPQGSVPSLFGLAKIWLPFLNRASNILLPAKKALNKQPENGVPSALWQRARLIMSKGYLPAQRASEMLLLPGEHPCSFQSLLFRTGHILILKTQ